MEKDVDAGRVGQWLISPVRVTFKKAECILTLALIQSPRKKLEYPSHFADVFDDSTPDEDSTNLNG